MRVKSGSGPLKKAGQTTVEMLLVLPVFLMLVFLVMELGMYCYQIILVNHGMFEAARVASLKAGNEGSDKNECNASVAESAAVVVLRSMFGSGASGGMIVVSDPPPEVTCVPVGMDGQNNTNMYDIELKVTFKLKLFFPFTTFAYGGDDNNRKEYSASLRMPVEQPVWCKDGVCK